MRCNNDRSILRKKNFYCRKEKLLPWKQMNDCLRSCWQFLFELIDEKLPVFRKVSAATFGLKLSKRQKACKKATIYLCGRNGNFWVFYCLKSNSEKSFKKKRMSCPHLSQKKNMKKGWKNSAGGWLGATKRKNNLLLLFFAFFFEGPRKSPWNAFFEKIFSKKNSLNPKVMFW